MPLTIDEAIEALTEMKREIGPGGGDTWLVTAEDSGYVRDMEIGWPPEPTDPFVCGQCEHDAAVKEHEADEAWKPGDPLPRPVPPKTVTFETREQATVHEGLEHEGDRTCYRESDQVPPEPTVVLLYFGDFASDAEEFYERMMDR